MRINPILRTDSYKISHYLQFRDDTDGYFGHIEARKAKPYDKKVLPALVKLMNTYMKEQLTPEQIDEIRRTLTRSKPFTETAVFGLQGFIKEYLVNPFTDQDIDKAEVFVKKHFRGLVPFNRKGWEYIRDEYGGIFPVTIKSVPEGNVIPEGNVLATIEATGRDCYWVAPYIESSLLRAIWYPSTVCTISRECKKVIWKYLQMSSDNPKEEIPYKLHDFGDRGVSSLESAGLGDAGHLVNFEGTDTIAGILAAEEYYDADMAGYSIAASEHGTITSQGKDYEVEAYRNMIKQFGKPGGIFACVSDSYDIFNACENIWGGELRDEVIASGATVVIRPDSGNPPKTVLKCLEILNNKFGSVQNSKGYNVLNCVRVIQGDGIDCGMIEEICETVTNESYSMTNVAFGMGGALLQHLNRDTLRFAMKCSATRRTDGKWYDAFKDPITDPMKRSKPGRISLYSYRNGHGASTSYATMRIEDIEMAKQRGKFSTEFTEVLQTMYENGNLLNESTFDEVRKRASL